MEFEGYKYERIDGGITGGLRQEAIDRFNGELVTMHGVLFYVCVCVCVFFRHVHAHINSPPWFPSQRRGLSSSASCSQLEPEVSASIWPAPTRSSSTTPTGILTTTSRSRFTTHLETCVIYFSRCRSCFSPVLCVIPRLSAGPTASAKTGR